MDLEDLLKNQIRAAEIMKDLGYQNYFAAWLDSDLDGNRLNIVCDENVACEINDRQTQISKCLKGKISLTFIKIEFLIDGKPLFFEFPTAGWDY